MLLTAAQIFAKCLKDADVQYVFELPGHGNIALLDGLIEEDIDMVLCHNETIAGHAADGYFRATNKPGVVCLTCSPGAMNAQLAITSSAMEASAVVYIVGDIPLTFAGKSCYEEFDLHTSDGQFEILKPMFKRAWKVNRVDLLPEAIAQAFNSATSGKPGPVLIDIPFDLHREKAEIERLPIINKRRAGYCPGANPEAIKEAAKILQSARKPVIIAGHGVLLSKASKDLRTIAEILGAPVGITWSAAGAMPFDHPNYVGVPGSYGQVIANEVCQKADVILAIGTRFEESETAMWTIFQIPPTKLIQIDIDSSEIGKNYEVEVGLVADAGTALRQLIEELGEYKASGEFMKELDLEAQRKAWMDRIRGQMTSNEIPLNGRRVLFELEQHIPDNTVLVSDSSWCRIGLMQQMSTSRVADQFVIGGLLPIGWSASAALGVQLARPGQKVISMGGDGGFLMTCQALATAVEYSLPITWVILNNMGYNALAVLQNAYFGRTKGSYMEIMKTGKEYSPDYAAMAKSFGADGMRVNRPEEIEPAIRKAMKADCPYVLDFRIDRDQSRLVRTAEVTWSYFYRKERDKISNRKK